MGVFDLFTTTNYTFLQLASVAGGFNIVEEYEANGIVKMRDGMLSSEDYEQREATGTIHIKPTEAFVEDLGANLVGHAVRVTKGDYSTATYRIIGQVEGFDYDTGEVEFYTVTLKPEEAWETSELSLE